jgi:antitoxin component YwqK of YwqJK toxin-antitoxin module
MLKNTALTAMVLSMLLNSLSSSSQEHIRLQGREGSQNTFVIVKDIHTQVYPYHLPQNGPMLAADTAGNILFSAFVKNHLLHGSWKSYYNLHQLIDSGQLIKGLPDGLWQTWYANGQLKSVRNYDADLYFRIKGDVDLNHPKVSRFVITERFKKEGRSVLNVFSAAYSYNRNLQEVPSSLITLTELNQENPALYHPPFVNALHHGLYMNFFENGILKDSGYYKDGLKEGLWLHRSDAQNGKWIGLYKHGLKQKEWKYYQQSGKLTTIVFFNSKGREEWRKSFQ